MAEQEKTKGTIIMAEDEESFRKTLEMILKMKFPELDIKSYEDGSSLESRLNKSLDGVRLVVTDNQMPGIYGSELIKKYAQRPEFRNLPFILLYGGDESIGREALGNGAFAYLIKPAEIDDIITTIRGALERYNPKASSQ